MQHIEWKKIIVIYVLTDKVVQYTVNQETK